ncbi:MAG: hypothetical protein JXM68_13055, partial [Sedimentisphaerales bacterium]|nr:hypothetical protein [Sedimentisphaerales bacterium]
MKLFREDYKSKDGTKQPARKWYLDFSDHWNRRHRLAAFTSKSASEALARQIESLISCRGSGQTLPVDLQRWIEGLPDSMIKNLVSWGL